MIILGSSHVSGSEAEVVFEDDFTGLTLDEEKWGSAVLGASSTVTQSNELILTGTIGAASNARVTSVIEIPTTGVVTLNVDWTPGKMYSGATGIPYIAILPGSPTRDGTYAFPYGYPGIRLGTNTDTTARTSLSAGIWNSTMGNVIGYIAGAAVTCNENTQYHLKWEVNWSASTTSLWLDGDPQVVDQTISVYSPSGAHYLEMAFCNYGAASNPIEKFDNLIITTE